MEKVLLTTIIPTDSDVSHEYYFIMGEDGEIEKIVGYNKISDCVDLEALNKFKDNYIVEQAKKLLMI